ncbi:MAG: hypothetical protein MOGMAGMI_00035 [Candidatus Omnitrophica bacterium]|nr:hypothetical protein [Candidatus Omnitrophota bacterium]
MSAIVSKALERLSLGAALAGAAACLAGFVHLTAVKMGYPFALGLGEAPLMQAVMRLAAGQVPYRELSTPPFSLVPYGPVYLGSAALLYKLGGQLYLGGRLITLAATLTLAVLIYRTVRERWHESGRSPAAAAALLFLGHPYVQQWSLQVNVDMLGVCLSLVTFRLLSARAAADRPVDVRQPLAAAVAFLTKSSMIAASAGYFTDRLLARRWGQALRHALLAGGAAAAVYAALWVWTDGWYYYHTTYEIGRRIVFYEFILFYWWDAFKHGPLTVFATVAFLSWPAVRRAAGRPLVLYLIFALLLTGSLAKQGSDTNYLLEWCALAAVCGGALLGQLGSARSARGAAVRTLAWALCAAQLWVWAVPGLRWESVRRQYADNAAFFSKIASFVRQAGGPVLSEDMSLILAAGKEIFYEPFPMGQMSYSGVWDDTLILRELDNKTFDVAILYFYAPALKRNRTFTERFIAAFNRNYVLVNRVAPPAYPEGALYVYRPRR